MTQTWKVKIAGKWSKLVLTTPNEFEKFKNAVNLDKIEDYDIIG